MAHRFRHVLALPGEVRVQVSFRRVDLLFRHAQPLRDPHAALKQRRARAEGLDADELELEVPGLPIVSETGVCVGPTILDMLVRRRWPYKELPDDTRRALRKAHAPNKPPHAVIAWSVRELDTLWPKPGEKQRREPRTDAEEEERELDHPFLVHLASGGEPLKTAPSDDDWVTVHKRTTCQVGEYVYRVAAGMYGSVDQAYWAVAAAARNAWDEDLERAKRLWGLVQAAPGKVLVEDAKVAAMRPICSISQQVERAIMREVCRWVGVDADLDVKRPRGRPRNLDNADQGRVIRVTLEQDGTVHGVFIATYQGVPDGTALHELKLHVLAAVLGALRTDGYDTDAALLEAWLDAATPDWRERVIEDEHAGGSMAGAPDPYEVLGVRHDASMTEVTEAYRKAMKAVHPDTSGGASAVTVQG